VDPRGRRRRLGARRSDDIDQPICALEVLMPTFALEIDEHHIIDSLREENDRTVAIVGSSLLEARLEEKLKAQFRTDSSKDNKKILADMFQGLGPLSSFSAKIRLGYLLRLYDYLVRIELTAIKGPQPVI
jgi:hypothetical protein